MGRPKTYDRDDVARKAMGLFWLHGFHGTTTQALAEHMGINSYSLFAEFTDKQGLFEAAMDLYEREVVTRHFQSLEADDAGLDDIVQVVKFFARNAGTPESVHGCFLCNVATERAPHDPASRLMVGAYVERITASLENALQHARRDGVLVETTRVADEARWLATTLLGFWVLLRAGADPIVIRGAARAAVAHLESLRP